jgi:hypothetical protein
MEIPDSVVERLRKSQQQAAEDEKARRAEGMKAGQEWAMGMAAAADLELLESRYDGRSAASVSPDFWDKAIGKDWDAKRAAYLCGFADGALDVWNEVKRRLAGGAPRKETDEASLF